ncbi:transposase [Azospirillum brasilense]|uniref:transposase n=1 Tax=Azospirillum brasilense TaxID=192 RepID=UPI001B3BBF6F|nr:transposase [Azospirillum brasilense]
MTIRTPQFSAPPVKLCNGTAYRRRNVIERLFGRLKNWRRIATQYDRLARNYLSAVTLIAAVTEWVN